MTRRFWLHLLLCAALAAGVSLFVRLSGYAPPGLVRTALPESVVELAGIYLSVLGFLYVFARLALRVTGSDRATGLLSVYAVSLYVPFVAAVTESFAYPLALLLISGAVLEILDIDLARANAVRSGLYLSGACVLEPSCAIVAAALLPVAVAVARRHWTLPLRFALAVALPWTAFHLLAGSDGAGEALRPLREAALAGDHRGLASALVAEAATIRASWEGEIHSTYAAFGLAGFLAGTVRRLGPSRRGVLAVSWLLGVATIVGVVLGDGVPPLFLPLAYALLVLLAGAGLAALAAMNPLHAGRRRMIPVGVFFLLPQVVVWVKLLV